MRFWQVLEVGAPLRRAWRRQVGQVLPTWATVALGVAVSMTAWTAVFRWEHRAAEVEFRALAETRANYLQHGIDEYVNKLVALRALFASLDRSISRSEFETFAGALLRNQAAIQSMSWIPRVPRAARSALEAAARADGLVDYHISAVAPDNSLVPAPERAEYFPIFYSTEMPRTSPVYGIDLGSEPMRRQTIERARDNDQMGASADFELHSGEGNRNGFFLVLPVYRKGLPHNSPEERRRNLRGFVHAAVQTAVMMDTILADAPLQRSFEHYLFAAGADAGPAIYAYPSGSRPAAAEVGLGDLTTGLHWIGKLAAGEDRWTLVTVPLAGETFIGHSRAWTVLSAGLLLTGFLAVYIWSSGRQAARLVEANEKITDLARKDPLTDLPNRRAFMQRLTECFAACRCGVSPFAVLVFDLDHFKDVNDTLGHPVGDRLLRQVAKRIDVIIRATDLVARFGGDEFAVLQTDVTEPAAAGTLAAKIVAALALPYTIDGNEVRVTASVGISLYSAELAGPDAIMMQADLALYRAKEDGRNRFRFHNGSFDRQVRARVTMSDELRLAIERGELALHYQPQVELASGRIVGMEALVRWQHRERGFIPPAQFIPIAERTGVIVPLGKWVFEEACRQMRSWSDAEIAPPVLAVNFSALQCKGLDVARDISESLARSGIRPGALEIELTESVLMEVREKQNDVLDELRELGVRLAIDDFGTGYSSLTYLTTYSVDRLKIAQELVFRVTSDARHAAVVRTAIRLARELGVECVAEGVETAAQASFLASAGCAYAQGFYFSFPLDKADATELLRRGSIDAARRLGGGNGRRIA